MTLREQKTVKTGFSAIYRLIFCILTAGIIGAGLWGLFGGGRVPPPAATTPIAISATSDALPNAEFDAKLSQRAFQSGLDVKYTGNRELEEVKIKLTATTFYINKERDSESKSSEFAVWKPGETLYFESPNMASRPRDYLEYSWSGTASLGGKRVDLPGGKVRNPNGSR